MGQGQAGQGQPPRAAEPVAQGQPGHPGREYFSRLTWIFSAHRPGQAPAAQTFTLPASGQP